MARFPVRRWPAHRVAIAGLVGGAVAIAAIVPAAGWWPLTLALFALAGLFDGPLLASVLQVRSAESPPHLLRVRVPVKSGAPAPCPTGCC